MKYQYRHFYNLLIMDRQVVRLTAFVQEEEDSMKYLMLLGLLQEELMPMIHLGQEEVRQKRQDLGLYLKTHLLKYLLICV